MERKEKIDTVHRRIDFTPHIEVDSELCASCEERACLYFCPASCFELDEDGGVIFHYEGCFECGTCRVFCDSAVKKWGYPQGGSGVYYRLG